MKFMAFDGKIFDTMAECEQYEKRCEVVELNAENIFFLKEAENGLTKTVDPLHADYVVIKGKFDSKAIEELFDSFDCYCDGLDEGVGAYYWDNDEEKWIKIYHKKCELEEEMNVISNTIDYYTNLEDKIEDKIFELIS